MSLAERSMLSCPRLALGFCCLLLFGACQAGRPLVAQQITHTSVTKPEVIWSGFAFRGRFADIGKRYPVTKGINVVDADSVGFLDKNFREFFKANQKAFRYIDFKLGQGDLDEGKTQMLALVMTEEQVLTEQLGKVHKCVVQLGFELLLLDYKGGAPSVVCSQPVFIEYRDAGRAPFNPARVSAIVRKMIVGNDCQLAGVLKEKCARLRVLGKGQGTIKVRKVVVGDKAKPFLPAAFKAGDLYAQFIAQQFSALMAGKAGVEMLPYLKDYANTKMSLAFVNGDAVQFQIPEATYGVDLDLRGFKKVPGKRTRAEQLLVYGAVLDVRVYEPEFNIEFFNAAEKHAVQKIIPASQLRVDEFPVVSEAFKGVCLKVIENIQKDAKTQKNVIKKCKL